MLQSGWLYTVTFTVPYPFFKTSADTFFPFLCGRVNRGAITGNGRVHEVNETAPVRFQEKKFLENLKKAEAWLHILRRFLLKFFKEFLNSNLFDRRLPSFLWL